MPKADKKWKNFLKLVSLMEYIFAPVTTVDKTVHMELLIEDFLSDFVQLYPERPLIPKMHYLVHVPMWTRRYEMCFPFNWVVISIFSVFQVWTFDHFMVHALRGKKQVFQKNSNYTWQLQEHRKDCFVSSPKVLVFQDDIKF